MKNLFSLSFFIALLIVCGSCSNNPTHSENELLLIQVLDVLAEQSESGPSFTGSFRYPAGENYAGMPVYKKGSSFISFNYWYYAGKMKESYLENKKLKRLNDEIKINAGEYAGNINTKISGLIQNLELKQDEKTKLLYFVGNFLITDSPSKNGQTENFAIWLSQDRKLKSQLYKGSVFYADHIGEGHFSYWQPDGPDNYTGVGMDLYRTELCDSQIEKLISLLKTPDFSADIFSPVESFPDECKYINELSIGESVIKKEEYLNRGEEYSDTLEYNGEIEVESSDDGELEVEGSDDGEGSMVLYKINDPDGWTNMRKSPNGEIIRTVDTLEMFEIIGEDGSWRMVRLENNQEGFIHNSRIIISN